MRDLSGLLTAHAFPLSLPRIRGAFARQPDDQTCGASAIRHGLLLGGLSIPTASLEAVLAIRAHHGTPPVNLLGCLNRLGLDAHLVRKRARQSTAGFLRRLRHEFERGAFLLPCIHGAEHWVCLGGWHDGRAALVDSFFDRTTPSAVQGRRPNLGFFQMTAEELDALDWDHFVTLVRPGKWQTQYRSWLPARAELLRIGSPAVVLGRGNRAGGLTAARQRERTSERGFRGKGDGAWRKRETVNKKGTTHTVVQALRQGVHQFLDDDDYSYRRLHLQMRGGLSVSVSSGDPGGDALGVEALGRGGEEVFVLRRLGGVLSGMPAPELVVRAAHLGAGYLAGG